VLVLITLGSLALVIYKRYYRPKGLEVEQQKPKFQSPLLEESEVRIYFILFLFYFVIILFFKKTSN